MRPLLGRGTHEELAGALASKHRYPNARAGYIVVTREYLTGDCRMRLRERLESFGDPAERRDWLARERGIKGLGYKEASHFLRNVGYSGYAILDKHICRSLAELGVAASPEPPSTRARYLALEERHAPLRPRSPDRLRRTRPRPLVDEDGRDFEMMNAAMMNDELTGWLKDARSACSVLHVINPQSSFALQELMP